MRLLKQVLIDFVEIFLDLICIGRNLIGTFLVDEVISSLFFLDIDVLLLFRESACPRVFSKIIKDIEFKISGLIDKR